MNPICKRCYLSTRVLRQPVTQILTSGKDWKGDTSPSWTSTRDGEGGEATRTGASRARPNLMTSQLGNLKSVIGPCLTVDILKQLKGLTLKKEPKKQYNFSIVQVESMDHIKIMQSDRCPKNGMEKGDNAVYNIRTPAKNFKKNSSTRPPRLPTRVNRWRQCDIPTPHLLHSF